MIKPIQGSFVIQNRGRQFLVLDKFKPSCGCIALRRKSQEGVKPLSREVIGCGEGLEIQFDLVIRTDANGRIQHSIEFSTNDPHRPTISVLLAGDFVPEIHCVPTDLYLGKIPTGQASEKTFRIVDVRPSGRRSPFNVKSSSSMVRVDDLSVSDNPSDRAGLTPDEEVYVARVSVMPSKGALGFMKTCRFSMQTAHSLPGYPSSGRSSEQSH